MIRFVRSLPAVTSVVLALACPIAFAQTVPRPKAIRLDSKQIPEALMALKPGELRKQRLQIDAALLGPDTALRFRDADPVTKRKFVMDADLFRGLSVAMEPESVTIPADHQSVTWTGKLAGQPLSDFVLAVSGDVVRGGIHTEDGRYIDLKSESGAVWAIETDPADRPEFGHPIKEPAPDSDRIAIGPRENTEDGSIIDVLVLYTARARAAEGGTPQMLALLNATIAQTNQGYAASQIVQRVRLVHAAETGYVESGTFRTDLERLTRRSDGFLEEAHTLRDQHGADLVALVVESGDLGGLAWFPRFLDSRLDESLGFSVNLRRALLPDFVLAHEMGHNMAANHDRANSQGAVLFPFAFGFQQTQTSPFFKTIMAYACRGVSCPGVNRWSSPVVQFNGIATGNAEADNRSVLNTTRTVIANYRAPRSATTSVSPTTFSFSSAGGTGRVTVLSGSAWQITSVSSFVTISGPTSGSGNAEIPFSVAANTGAARTGGFSINGQNVTVNQAAAPPACNVLPAGFGVNINGSLAANSCVSPIRRNTFAARFSFSGTAGQRVSIAVSSQAFDTYLYLVGPNGTIVAEDDDGGGALNSRIPPTGFFTLTQTGTHTIEVTSFDPGVVGAFTLTLNSEAACTFTVAPGSVNAASGQFNGRLDVTSPTGCAWTASTTTPWITISSGDRGAGNGSTAFQLQPNTGTAARSGSIAIAGRAVTVNQAGVAAGCASPSVQPAQVVTGQFTSAGCRSNVRGANTFSARFTLNATAGQRLYLELRSPTADTYLYLFSPSGRLIAEDDDSAGDLNSRIPGGAGALVLPDTGTYLIEATTFDENTPGAFLLNVRLYAANLPAPTVSSVVHGGTFLPGIAPQAWITIFGANLSPGLTKIWDNISNEVLPTALEGVAVRINGQSAATYFISPTQLNVQVPDDTASGPVNIEVVTPGGIARTSAEMRPIVPGLFFTLEGYTVSRQYAAAQHPNGQVVHRPNLIPGTRPASPGQSIALYGTGFGPTNPRVDAGLIVPRAAPLATPFVVRVGGIRATVEFGGIIGAGLYQFNIRVPAELPSGDHSVTIEIDGRVSPSTLVIPVQR